jgi:hypothetical protein
MLRHKLANFDQYMSKEPNLPPDVEREIFELAAA